jgi:hypothetical protein
VRCLVPGLPALQRSPRPAWTRPEVAAVVDRLMRDRFGLALDWRSEDKTWDEMGIY